MTQTNGIGPDRPRSGRVPRGPHTADDTEPGQLTFGRIVAALAFIAVAGFWIWAFSPWAPRGNPDRLDQPIRVRLEAICATVRTEIDAVPAAGDAVDLEDRANQIDQVTVLLDGLLVRLEPAIPADDPTVSGDDHDLLTEWLSDWEIYLGDRRAHTALLRDGIDARFVVTEFENKQITRRIDAFAETSNEMPSCATPLDL